MDRSPQAPPTGAAAANRQRSWTFVESDDIDEVRDNHNARRKIGHWCAHVVPMATISAGCYGGAVVVMVMHYLHNTVILNSVIC